MKASTIVKFQSVDAGVGRVKKPQTDKAPRHTSVGLNRAVYQDRAAMKPVHHGRHVQPIGQNTVSVEEPVLNDDRDVVYPPGRRQTGVRGVGIVD